MGQCCGMEKRITMGEVSAGVNGADQLKQKDDNPYLESKAEKKGGKPQVQAKSIHDSDVGSASEEVE